MTFSDLLLAGPQRANRCRICQLIAELPTREQQALQGLLENKRYTLQSVSDAIWAEGFEGTRNQVSYHRRTCMNTPKQAASFLPTLS